MNWTLAVGIVAAIAASIGTAYTLIKDFLRLRDKNFKELPSISLSGGGEGRYFYCHLESEHGTIDWKILRVDVKQAEFGLLAPTMYTRENPGERKFLAQMLPPKKKGELTTYGNYGEWQDFCEWSKDKDLYEMLIHDYCGRAVLLFTCEMPSRTWWNFWRKQVKISSCYNETVRYPMLSEHPSFRDL